ncbi:MAG: prepilin-type N-terminal cleavage/methylation domain-containing protein [Patescibacteria group bacterium]|mgnify:CR=1 FL=1
MKFIKKNKGFTLLEIIIVVAIIAVLAVILLPRLARVRQPANDARRINDLRTIQGFLETYYLKNRYYPSPSVANTQELVGYGSNGASSCSGICAILTNPADQVTASVPDDPTAGFDYYYAADSNSNAQSYVLKAILQESSSASLDNDVDGTALGMDCDGGTPETAYCIQF